MKNNIIRSVAILAIVIVVFSVIAFVLPLEHTAVFWLAYFFGLISVGVFAYSLYAGFVRGDVKRSRLYGFPVVRIGAVYMAAQLILSLVFMLLLFWVEYWLATIVFILALAIAALGLITGEAVREEIEQQDEQLKKDVKTIRTLQSKARSLVSLCQDGDTAAVLQAFSDDLQYSDPVSGEALTNIEMELSAMIDDIQMAVLQADYAGTKILTKKAAAVLNERNRLCKLNKS